MMNLVLGGRLDPSHLVALHVLLEERHVTRAAARVGISQSSMSHRLARLRAVLGDPLFVRAGARLLPTARAADLARPLAQALAALEAAVAPPAAFDPSTSRARVTIALPDLLAPAIGPVLASIQSKAPYMDLRCTGIPARFNDWIATGPPCLGLVPTRFVDESAMSRAVGELRFGVAMRRGHPASRGKLTVARWLSHGHIVVRTDNDEGNPIDTFLEKRGYQRRIGLAVPAFLMGLLTVANSDLLMNVPLPLAERSSRQLSLVLRPAPMALPTVRFAMAWHSRMQEHPAHAWVRERLASALTRELG